MEDDIDFCKTVGHTYHPDDLGLWQKIAAICIVCGEPQKPLDPEFVRRVIREAGF